LLLACPALKAQKTIVHGIVTDAETKEPIPFANLVFQHSTVGTISDIHGSYYLETSNPADTLLASCLGYLSEKATPFRGKDQILNFSLQPIRLNIEEVVIRPGENPAFQVLRDISANKARNNPDRFSTYQYKSYNKLRLDMNNVGEKFDKRPVIRKFDFAFEYMDSSEIFGKNYLPILISESMTRFYYQNDPRVERELIDAFQISGIQNNTFSQFSGKMYQRLNIYDNYLSLFEPGFVSPIADFGRAFYDYILEDSAYVDDTYCFKISFKPKRKLERTFNGYFWVADTSFAIKKVQLRVSPTVNINYLNDLIAINEYSRLNDSTWFLTREEILLDFYLSDKNTGFFGKKVSIYDDIVINDPIPDSILNLKTDTYAREEELEKNNAYWNENRPEPLEKEDLGVYTLVDSVVKVPTYKRIYSLLEMVLDYYFVLGPVELGPYYTFYSYNPVEGHRIKFGGRTSNHFNEKFRFGGYAAYGTLDKTIKYGASGDWMINTDPRVRISASYFHDIRQLGKSDNAFLDDNIMTTFLRRNPNYKLSLVDQLKVEVEKEWLQGFSHTLSFKHEVFFPGEYVLYTVQEGSNIRSLTQITTAEISLNTHFSYREKFLLGTYERKSLGSNYPILDLDLSYAPRGLLGNDYEYLRVRFALSDKLETNPLGYLRYRLIAGKIFGSLPYLLLELHDGNETYAYDPYAFNMMNYYEFVSDQYLILSAEQHFQGFFFNRIPFLRWLKLREVVTVKYLIGSLEEKNREQMIFPEGLTPLDKPYVEASLGIENLFKLVRIDAMWRFSYLDHEAIEKFGIRVALQVSF
ncbi:MAG: carboxypeptidase-like regulatory domain-containing protein, partial [Bacteroidales bacterium]|nr:carboxypeptidase-like regulatory domain-containing protein [Bacteroidales bacterium]